LAAARGLPNARGADSFATVVLAVIVIVSCVKLFPTSTVSRIAMPSYLQYLSPD
jgi:hypothetical protein